MAELPAQPPFTLLARQQNILYKNKERILHAQRKIFQEYPTNPT